MDVLRLAAGDCRLLSARYAEHANSHRRMAAALEEAGADVALARLRALRILERRFGIDLGSLCWRWCRLDDPAMHPFERYIVRHVTRVHRTENDAEELLVLLDHVRQVRELMEGRLVGERDT